MANESLSFANSSTVVDQDQLTVTERMMVLFSSGPDFGSGLADESSSNTTELASEDDYVYDYDFNSSFNNYDWAELVPAVVVYSFVLLLGISGNGESRGLLIHPLTPRTNFFYDH